QITVLFADISGFTALAERLGPEELHENMRTVWDLIAADIRANGGLIEKYIGDAVVAAFGAVGDDNIDHPEQAQRAALAILAALDDALAGRGRLVSIVGESGLGKSRLIGELLADPRVRGSRVGRVRGTPYDQHRSYGAVGDLLRRVVGIHRTASADHALHLIT